MRLIAVVAVVAGAVACSSCSSVYVSSTCPMNFSYGLPGAYPPDAGVLPQPTYSCQPLPKECVNNPTCDCLACHSDCHACIPQGGDEWSYGGGGGATCNYDEGSGTFTVACFAS